MTIFLKGKAKVELSLEPRWAKALYDSLQVEVRAFRREVVGEIKTTKKGLTIYLESNHLSTFRAALNSQLRMVWAASESLESAWKEGRNERKRKRKGLNLKTPLFPEWV